MEQTMDSSVVQLDGTNQNSSKNVSRVKKLLFRRMLVGVNDGRYFMGAFHCIDKQAFSLPSRSWSSWRALHSQNMEQTMDSSVVQLDGTNQNSSKNVSRVKKLLFRRMLVGVNDGRYFMGAFHCIDKQGNIILQDAVEFRSTRRSSPAPMEQRCLGLILIPSSCRSSCNVDCSIEEQLSLLSLGKSE
ncbi:Small nuclear ribonucleoprotein family protein [Thalictrum thalictroides]|uniref:Small nuclear ribonucleoprotein family protein n=1 Tax=Thalictrum thalictroides TaxID=46969 RepID=A0A7J6XCE2_THATH|nr:Small nuclear ribonucleoprotein family protein [Thalictrum thalictroides]